MSTNGNAPPHDLEAERSVIGAVLLSPEAVMRALNQLTIEPGHFYREAHREIFSAMKSLEGNGRPIDHQTVRFELDRVKADQSTFSHLESCVGAVPEAANVREYAGRVVELAEWRHRSRVAHDMLLAVGKEDRQAWGAAHAALEHVARPRTNDTYSPQRWADVLYDHFAGKEPPRTIPMPLPRLTDALFGGLWPGEVMLIAGYTSDGKSIWADQIMDTAARAGYRCHAYLTEMTALLRGLRLIARKTGIPFGKLRTRKLDQRQMEQVMNELGRLPYGITIASGWDIDQVVADSLYARWDLVVIDLIHGFRYEDERGLDRLSKAMQRLAITSTTIEGFAGTSVIGIAHLNRGQGTRRTRPTLSDLKGGSSLEQDADFVNFVWQEPDENGLPSGRGAIWLAKGRSGSTEGVDVVVNPRYFRFEMASTEES